MKRILLTASVVVLSLAGSYVVTASAAEPKVVRGTITTVAANSVSISAGQQPMTFTVDSNTRVEARGAGTKSREAQAAGKPGAKLTELVEVGQAVEIAYADSNGAMVAKSIRRIAKVSSVDPAGVNEARGKVTAISGSSLTIAGSSGGHATFTQTYAIDRDTHIIGKGVGTAMAANGGRASISDVVSVGETVSVSYRAGDPAPRATEVRVMK
jgi:hypothetical protein